MSVPVTPVKPEDFTREWCFAVMKNWFIKNDINVETVKVDRVEAKLNSQQGLLSTTYIVDVYYEEEGKENVKKSIFVKVPLTGDASKDFKQVNVREHEMYTNVLPLLQQCLDDNCSGFFCLGFPEVIHCYYSGDEIHDAFITENLCETGYLTCTTKDLHIDRNGKDYLKSTLETLSQLHGTGFFFKKSLGGNKKVLEKFPKIEEQITLRLRTDVKFCKEKNAKPDPTNKNCRDILSSKENRNSLRKNFCPFIRYLEETDPDLKNITSYMRKMEAYLFKILKVLDDSGVGNLNTLCHGDAKPNNFMFRRIDIDFSDDEDEDLKNFKCEGVESLLIDWQGGFLGSICNDLMWCLYPFFEVNSHDKDLYEFAFRHYYDELKNVLETFHTDLQTFGLPEEFAEFRSLIRRGFVLEFLIVTVLRPVLNITSPGEITKWHDKIEKFDKMKEKGGIHSLMARKKPKMPSQEKIFDNPRYMEFLQFYFKIATALGAFQELGLVYFELMKDGLFKDTTSPLQAKPKKFTKEWFKNKMNFACISGATEAPQEDEDEEFSYEPKKVEETVKEEVTQCEEKIQEANFPTVEEDEVIVVKDENVYEPVLVSESIVRDSPEEMKAEEEEREETPDPLQRIAAQLHGQLQGYKADFDQFSNLMEEHKPADPPPEPAVTEPERKLSREEEISLVKTMSKQEAWSHVMSQVYEEKKEEKMPVVNKNINLDLENIEEKCSRIESRMERLNRNISSMNEKHAQVDAKLAENEVKTKDIETAVDEKQSKLEESGDVSKCISTPEAPRETNSRKLQTCSSSEEMMKKISEDVDLSNQKVLQTIEFLSQNSSGPDSPASPRDEEEKVCEVEQENEEAAVGTRDSIRAWLSLTAQPASWNTEQPEEEPSEQTEVEDLLTETKSATTEICETATAEIDIKSEVGNQSVDRGCEPESSKASILQWLSLSSHPKEWLGEDKCLSEKITAAELVDKLEELEELKMNEKKAETPEAQATTNEDETLKDQTTMMDDREREEISHDVVPAVNKVMVESLKEPNEEIVDMGESSLKDTSNQSEELLNEEAEVHVEPHDDLGATNVTTKQEKEITVETLQEDNLQKVSAPENEECKEEDKVEETTDQQNEMISESEAEEPSNGDDIHQSSSADQEQEMSAETQEEPQEPKKGEDIATTESSSTVQMNVEQDVLVDTQEIQQVTEDSVETERESSTKQEEEIKLEESEEPQDLCNNNNKFVQEKEEDESSLKVENTSNLEEDIKAEESEEPQDLGNINNKSVQEKEEDETSLKVENTSNLEEEIKAEESKEPQDLGKEEDESSLEVENTSNQDQEIKTKESEEPRDLCNIDNNSVQEKEEDESSLEVENTSNQDQEIKKEESEELNDLCNIDNSSAQEREEDQSSITVENTSNQENEIKREKSEEPKEETREVFEEPVSKEEICSTGNDANVEPKIMEDMLADTLEHANEDVINKTVDVEEERLQGVVVEENQEPKLNVECSLEVETVKPNSGYQIDCSNSEKKNLDRTFSSEVDECRRNIEHIQNDFFSKSEQCEIVVERNETKQELREESTVGLEVGAAEVVHHQEGLEDECRMEIEETSQEIVEDEEANLCEETVPEIDQTVNNEETKEIKDTASIDSIGTNDREDSNESNDNVDEPPTLIETESVLLHNIENEENTLKNSSKENIESEKEKISRATDSRMSIKKRKQRDSMRKNQEEKDSILTEESKRKSKSIEVFDFYVNSIDDEGCSKRQIEKINLENMKTNTETAEKNDIADILNSSPIDTNAQDEGALFTTEMEDTEDLPPCKSNQGSRCNTLRRRKNTRNSKKRRKSKHIL